MNITFNINNLINEAPNSFEECMEFLRKVKEDSFYNFGSRR